MAALFCSADWASTVVALMAIKSISNARHLNVFMLIKFIGERLIAAEKEARGYAETCSGLVKNTTEFLNKPEVRAEDFANNASYNYTFGVIFGVISQCWNNDPSPRFHRIKVTSPYFFIESGLSYVR